jgi:DNA-binding winged helix-turn-helix (wHTH) protein
MTLFRILGPLEVDVAGDTVPLGGPKQRAVLAHLVLRANQLVPAETLIDQIWPEEPPEKARNVIQTYVSHLRKALDHDRIESHGPGYRLRLDPSEEPRCRPAPERHAHRRLGKSLTENAPMERPGERTEATTHEDIEAFAMVEVGTRDPEAPAESYRCPRARHPLGFPQGSLQRASCVRSNQKTPANGLVSEPLYTDTSVSI